MMVLRAAGIVPARRTAHGWQLLILRARHSWEFPKVGIDPTEDPIGAAKREAREKTGLTDLRFPFGTVHRDPAPYSRGKLPRYYLAVTEQELITLQPSGSNKRPDHEEARWVSFEDGLKLLPQRLGPVLEWARKVLSGK